MNTSEDIEDSWNKLNATMDRLATVMANAVIERVQANLNEKWLKQLLSKNHEFIVLMTWAT